MDPFLGKLGRPVGLKCYKPLHSVGEDFLHTYLGMVGIPMELTPEFPSEANTIFLAESAAFDSSLVIKIKQQLLAGKNVIITSGLLHALQGKGIEEIAEIRYTSRKIAIRDFVRGYGSVIPGDSGRLHELNRDAFIDGQEQPPAPGRWPGNAAPKRLSFDLHLKPHSYRVFAVEK